jgi:ribitol-5-phosphate 2-dehydrogenase
LINYVYQLVSPKVFSVKYEPMQFTEKAIVRPVLMSICHADQRYYLGKRDRSVLKDKLPMALIHECCGEVIYDPSGTFEEGQLVAMVPNTPVSCSNTIYENYRRDSYFLSSGHDGFMREYVDITPDRMVPLMEVPPSIGAITEFVSVGVHAATRFDAIAHKIRKRIGIWGDGSLGFVVACIIKSRFPECSVAVIGRDYRKLSYFSFADETYISDSLPEDFEIDHAFECCGGEGSYYAINDIIRYINPQGTVMLMGVSENKVAIDTRDTLEKGITMVGSSRSGVKDFQMTAELMKNKQFQNRLNLIIYKDEPVCSIEDVHRVFRNDLATPFKTVFEWQL